MARTRPVDVGILFIGKNSWQTSYAAYLTNEVLRPDGAVRSFSQNGICPVLTVPLVTEADYMKFDMVAGGGIDAEHLAIARKIHEAIGEGTIYLRLGHEADEGYPWSYTNPGDIADPATYKAAWSRIAKIYKAEIPNARIVWNVLKNTRQRIRDYYPGSDVVDILSIDPYDNGAGGFCDGPASPGWVNMCYGGYNAATGESKGVKGILDFAKTQGKRIAIDEWGASNKSHTVGDGANNGYYAGAMYDFFNANRDYIEYESYYNRAGAGKHQIWPRVDYNGKVSDAYLAKYKGTVPIPPLTPPPTAICPPGGGEPPASVPPPPTPPPANCTGTGTPVEVSSAGQFQSVLRTAVPGTTIMLLPGNYGTLNVERGGSGPAAPIYIAAKYPAVGVDAQPLASIAQRSNVSLITMNASNVTICGIFFDDKSLKSIRHDKRADNLMYLQNYFNTETASSPTVEESIDTYDGGTNLTVQSNYFNATRNNGFALDYGLALFKYNGVYVRGNIFDGVFNHALSLKQQNENVLIDGNVFKGCGQQCLEIGQQPDNRQDGDWTGGQVTITNNIFTSAYTIHPQGRATKALVLRNHETIIVRGNTFQQRFNQTIQTNFINRGGLDRLAGRVLGVWERKANSILIEGNTFNDALLNFTGRGIGPKNGGRDTIEVRGNTGPFTCRIGPWERAAGKTYDMSTIDESPPNVTGCP